jgi:hypothetical protein
VEKSGREKVYNRGMEEAPEKGEESSHSANSNGMDECVRKIVP